VEIFLRWLLLDRSAPSPRAILHAAPSYPSSLEYHNCQAAVPSAYRRTSIRCNQTRQWLANLTYQYLRVGANQEELHRTTGVLHRAPQLLHVLRFPVGVTLNDRRCIVERQGRHKLRNFWSSVCPKISWPSASHTLEILRLVVFNLLYQAQAPDIHTSYQTITPKPSSSKATPGLPSPHRPKCRP